MYERILFSSPLYETSCAVTLQYCWRVGGESSVGSLVAPRTVLPFIKADLLKEKKSFIAGQTTQWERRLAMFALYPYRTQRLPNSFTCVSVHVFVLSWLLFTHSQAHMILDSMFEKRLFHLNPHMYNETCFSLDLLNEIFHPALYLKTAQWHIDDTHTHKDFVMRLDPANERQL